MPGEKYHKTYLEEQLPVELREQLRFDNLDPTHLPTYEYLNSKGFETRGLNQAVKRHYGAEMTLHKFLKDHGFGYRGDEEWPTTHPKTLGLLNGYRDSRKNRNGDRDPTVATMESAMRGVLHTIQDLHGTTNLLHFARYEAADEKYEVNEQVEEVIDTIKSEKSDGAAENYIRYWKDFYEYAAVRTRIDHNPVMEVEGQYSFDYNPQKDRQPVADEQIRTLWETLKHLPDREQLSDPVMNLADRHGLQDWQVMMMTLLVLGIGVGPRASDIIRSNCREHWVLDEKPYIKFPVRKNLPGQVPVLTHPEFLQAYIDYMEATRANWNGKPFPSNESGTGSRSAKTLNNWLKALCIEANVELDDGSYPSLQNLRQTWHNQYLEVLRVNQVRLQLVADEQGTRDEDQIDISYRTTEEERESIRSLASRKFEELLPLSELPAIMANTLNESQYYDKQTDLDEF